MTKKDFLNFCENKYIFLDGATGSNLVKAGMPSGICPEAWILEHREVLLSLQKAYIEAGSNILYAPTFGANRIKLKEYGMAEAQKEMIQKLVTISKEAAADKNDVLVAGDITMTGELLKPLGTMELEELIEIYKEQILNLEAAGVDLLVVETMMSLAEARAALIAAREASSLPVMVSMSFEGNGRTLYGTDAKTAAVVLESLGACAVGVNCSAGPASMQQIIADMASVTNILLIAKPNAGLPDLDEQGNTCYNMDSKEFAEGMALLTEKGASLLGGCCGTDPTYIAALKEAFAEKSPAMVRRGQPGLHYLTSERKTAALTEEEADALLGGSILRADKAQLQPGESMIDKALEKAEEMEAEGAAVFSLDVRMCGSSEKEQLLGVLEEIGMVTNLPLCITPGSADALEAALRAYCGRALINFDSLEQEQRKKCLSLAEKYGAAFCMQP